MCLCYLFSAKTAWQLVNRKADFFYKTNRFASICITNRRHSNRELECSIANWCQPATTLRSITAKLRCTQGEETSQSLWSRYDCHFVSKKSKGSPYSIIERRVPELIPVLGSQPASDVSHKPGGRLPLLSARPAVTPATLKRVATNFAAWWTEAQRVWAVCLRLLPDSVATAIWTRAILRPSPAR